MNQLDTLRGAREIIADASRWTWGNSAVDKYGRPVADPQSENAERFCAVGALMRVGDQETVMRICVSVTQHEHHTLWWINDNQGHAAAIATLDREIARCEAEMEAAKPVITFGLPG